MSHGNREIAIGILADFEWNRSDAKLAGRRENLEVALATTLTVELNETMTGSPDRMLSWDGYIGDVDLTVMFSAELLGHWPKEEWVGQLGRLFPKILAATKRCIEAGRYAAVFDANDELDRVMIILSWRDISH